MTKDSGDRQVPWESSSLKGEFFFLPGAPGKSAEELKREQQAAIDRAVGDAVKQSEERAAKEREALQAQMQKMIAEMLAKQRAELDAERKACGEAPVPQVVVSAAPAKPVAAAPAPEPAPSQPAPASAPAEVARPTSSAPVSSTASVAAPTGGGGTTAPVQSDSPVQVAGMASSLAVRRPGVPAIGDTWTYRGRIQNQPDRVGSVEIRGVSDAGILEEAIDQSGRVQMVHGPELLVSGLSQRFNPYHMAFHALREGESWSDIPYRADACRSPHPLVTCRITGRVVGREKVTVPAGTFDAWKVEIAIVQAYAGSSPSSHELAFWYAEDARRYVKATRKVFGSSGATNYEIELVEMKLN